MLTSVITGVQPGIRFGRLKVGGKATLSGTLHVNTGGGFTPGHRESFAVLVCHSRGGTFSKRSGQPAFKVGYGETAVKVIYP